MDLRVNAVEKQAERGAEVKELFNIPERLETLAEFQTRTWFVYEPQFRDGFAASPGVSSKVAPEDGALLPYAGNTVVLTLPEAVRQNILHGRNKSGSGFCAGGRGELPAADGGLRAL